MGSSQVQAGAVRRPDVTLQIVGRDAILHDPLARQAHVVNGSAARIWELCDGRPFEAIVDAFAASYGITADRVRPDVERVLDSFREKGLLE